MDVHPEYVMLGNDVLLKCSFPSFVADFVTVLSWIDSEASEYSLGTNHEGNSARNRLEKIPLYASRGTANILVWPFLLFIRHVRQSGGSRLQLRYKHFRFSCQPRVQGCRARRVCCLVQRCSLQVQHPKPRHRPRNCLGLG